MKKKLMLLLIISAILTVPVMASTFVEDFEYAQPAVPNFVNGIFEHNIHSFSGVAGEEYWAIGDIGSGDGNVLCLWPAIDTITFDLASGDIVNYVSLDVVDWNGGTKVEFVGTLDSYSVTIPSSSVWTNVNTAGLNLGSITSIDLSSYEGSFDNIAVSVVPEPASLALLAIGGLILRRSKR